MLAPEKLGAWLSSPSNKYIPTAYRDMPVFKWGQGSLNYEAYIAARPDIVFVGSETGTDI